MQGTHSFLMRYSNKDKLLKIKKISNKLTLLGTEAMISAGFYESVRWICSGPVNEVDVKKCKCQSLSISLINQNPLKCINGVYFNMQIIHIIHFSSQSFVQCHPLTKLY